ncbi:M48 family metalloprotease [Veillonella ratti]|uniref:M48 family metalloprotease n=1 Tax=Veillonella ratti TaxID=103892 RepID=UPI000F8F69E5|nr:M48 family metalloprotease [Veillonella ratti]
MKRWGRTVLAAAIGITLAGGSGFTGLSGFKAEAAGIFDVLLGGTMAMVTVNTELSRIDDTDDGQQQMLEERQKSTGYYNNYAYQDRAKRIFESLTDTPDVKRTYVVYVTPEEDANAAMSLGRVMSINKGLMDMMDDAAIASVVGHEIGHGENKDAIRGIRKSVALQTAVGAATANAGGLSVLLGNVAGNYVNQQVFSVSQEKAADEWGFKLLADAGYNVGAAAVAMAVLRDKYGDLYTDGLGQIVNPNNHPKMSQRILDHLKRIEDYSGKHVSVTDDVVYVNKKPVYTGEASGQYTGAMRAYLVAGKLARYYHDNNVGTPVAQGNQVLMNGSSLVTLSSVDKAATMEQDLKAAIDSKHSKKVKGDDKSKADKKDKKAKVKTDTKVKTDNTAASKANFE